MNYFSELQQTLGKLDPSSLLDFIRACEGTLWLAGNGGSASTAQHWACDLSKAAGRRVQALGSNPAVLTAWANDDDYDTALMRELSVFWREGDALICLSCSGTSGNVQMLLWQARQLNMPCALVTGAMFSDGIPDYIRMMPTDLTVTVPHEHYGIIEDCHLAIGHWLTEELRG